ncbi:MAG: hypothetical protein ACP5G7_05975, partial [Anaerolineae bacterium]
LLWVVWALASVAVGAGLYYLPAWLQGVNLPGYTLVRLNDMPADVPRLILPVILGPPVIYLALLITSLAVLVVGGALVGAMRGMVLSFTT